MPKSVSDLWGKALRGDGPQNLKCPNCSRPMIEVGIEQEKNAGQEGGRPLIQLDVCRACHFLWFDLDELERLPQIPPPEPTLDERMPQEAKELLALRTVERIREQSTVDGPSETWQWLPAMVGLPVEQDRQLRVIKPWVTWIVAVLCLLVFGLTFQNLDQAIGKFGWIPSRPMRWGGLTWITSFFLHGGIWHLVGNLYFLLVFGDNVEAVLGKAKYLLLLSVAAAGGLLLHGLFDPRDHVPLIGASGGISGIVVCYALLFPRARLGLVWGMHFLWRWFSIPAGFALVGWILLQVIGTVQQLKGFSHVSALAHFGGAAVGLVFWIALRVSFARFDRNTRRSTQG